MEKVFGDLLDSPRNAETVHPTHRREGLEHEQVETSVRNVGLEVTYVGHLHEILSNSIRTVNIAVAGSDEIASDNGDDGRPAATIREFGG